MRLSGKNILITGGGHGIGRKIALACAREGANMALCGRTRPKLESAADQISRLGQKAIVVELDLQDPKSVTKCVEQVTKGLGSIDALINNAAAFARGNVVDLSVEDWDKVINTNLRGAFLMSRAVLPQMIAAKKGDIVFISSTSGKRSDAGSSVYGASKHGLNGFAMALLYEVRKHNIRVMTVSPSAVDVEDRGLRRPNRLQDDDIAESVVSALVLPNRALVRDIELWATNP
jgi:3-oxoacyl-[acyl-carrier protein] reductase